MRFTHSLAVLGLLAMAGCATPPNTAAPAGQVAANSQDPTAAAVRKPKNCIVGTRVCTKEQEFDPTVLSVDGGAFAQSMQGHQVGGKAASP